ncbi:MAG: carboxypeptidase-like regulatory domain-containing protein, partial [Bacteroidetes bacterium]|nr:carboxypeptidase-like regulatory domain-containing protein [Bacteroidota bacterium]
MKDKSIAEIISFVSDLGNVKFSYSPQQVPVNKKISVKAKNKTIKEVLNEVLKENGIDYFVLENQIILKPQKISNNENPVVKEIQKYTISGYLKDKLTGEILIGATVYAKGTSHGTVSNAYGFYSLTLPKDTYNLVFSFIGYENQTQPIILNENKKISIEFETSKLKMKEVEIISNENKSEVELQTQLSEFKLSPKLLSQLTGFVGEIDIIKSLQAIPGIKSYGDGSTLFYVRGGNSDQNLILIDEVPIYNPSHLFGFFTAIAPDAIKDVEAYKGDFPANFGGRLSSVIDIRTKDGNMKKFGFSGSLGPFTSNLTFEGPIKKDKCSFFLSGRRSNLDWL